MNVPYADPRHPFHKKSAFDLGDAGAGIMANNLKLGCDCLGSIYYISGLLAEDNGMPIEMPNIICVHEQDNGIGWKHTNYRTQRAAIVRSRELVVQSIITVANYEYVMAFVFNQAAEMMYEVRATGIVSTQPIDDCIQVPFGTVVHPGVLAVDHQHIFSLRLDPHLDGSKFNRLVYGEAHPMTDEMYNPHGNGYYRIETIAKTSGGYDLAPEHNRTFKIQNSVKINPISGNAVGYKIMVPPFQKLLSRPGSFNYRRAEFGTHNIFAIKYKPDELYASGRYTNQSRGDDGVAKWAARKDDIVDEDIVLFIQFGINHIPRVEDFPVMPCETIKVGFKPVDFFDRNPAIDVPPSTQAINKSVGLNGVSASKEARMHHQSVKEVKIRENGKASRALVRQMALTEI
jgi:primary-amine oxidase